MKIIDYTKKLFNCEYAFFSHPERNKLNAEDTSQNFFMKSSFFMYRISHTYICTFYVCTKTFPPKIYIEIEDKKIINLNGSLVLSLWL